MLGAPYQQMGLRVLWIRDFDDTARILDAIRDSKASTAVLE